MFKISKLSLFKATCPYFIITSFRDVTPSFISLKILFVFKGFICNSLNLCTLVFTAALVIIAKKWRQPKCPSTKKMWYLYTMAYYSAIKEDEIMPLVATQMDLEIIILSEISQKEKDKYRMISSICGI